MEGWLMSETRHGISWQKGIFADKFFRGPVERWEKLSKIPFLLFFFFLFYFSFPLLRRGIFIPFLSSTSGRQWRYFLVERFAIKKSGGGGGATHPRWGREELSSYIDTKRGEIMLSLGWRRWKVTVRRFFDNSFRLTNTLGRVRGVRVRLF